MFKKTLFSYFKVFTGVSLSALSYTLVPLFFLKYITHESALGVASQYQIISLILGIFHEVFFGITLFLMAKGLFQKYINFYLKLIFFIGFLIFIGFYFLLNPIIHYWGVPEEIRDLTLSFLRISSFSIPFLLLNSCLTAFIINSSENKYLIVKIFTFLSSLVVNGVLFFPSFFPSIFSLDINLLGYNYLIQSILSFLFYFYLFRKISSKPSSKILLGEELKLDKKFFLKIFSTLSVFIFTSSLLRNISYSYSFLIPINKLGVSYSSAWYLLSSLFWNFYLIPVLAFAQWVQIRSLEYKKLNSSKSASLSFYKKALTFNLCLVLLIVLLYKYSSTFILNNWITLNEISFYQKLGVSFLIGYSFYSFSYILRSIYYAEGLVKALSSISIIASLTVISLTFLLGVSSFSSIKLLFCIDLLLETFLLLFFLIFKLDFSKKRIDIFFHF